MTTLSERVERLRKQREHCAICEGCDGGATLNGMHHTRKSCRCMATMALYPGVGDPREAYLDALALAWELAPESADSDFSCRWVRGWLESFAANRVRQEEPR